MSSIMKKRISRTLAGTAVMATLAGIVVWAATTTVDDLFDPSQAPIGSVGMPAVNNHLLYTGNTGTTVNASSTRLYAIDYDSSEWSGNLHSYPLTSSGAVVKVDDWVGGIAAKIDVQKPNTNDLVPTGRFIFTKSDVTGVMGLPFRWNSMSTTQRTTIDPSVSTSDSTREKILEWVRGKRGDEGTDSSKLRKRGSTVGDIIHSTPIYCPGTVPQSGVATCTADTVFVGANDGMLHAINAATGTERWGYIPSVLIPKLRNCCSVVSWARP